MTAFLRITKTLAASAALAGTLLTSNVWAQQPSHLEHEHSAGTFMVEYQFMRMDMEGMGTGTDDLANAAILQDGGTYNYVMTPTDMRMDMHMLMPMYNITSQLSLMAMFNYLDNSMDMVARDGTTSTMTSSGMGDTQVNLAYKFMDNKLAAGLTVNIPTGSIDEKGSMKMSAMMTMSDIQLPYAMQLGSGTYDVTPTLTYLGAHFRKRYGAQLSYTVRTGDNDNGYTLGNEARASTWFRFPMGEMTVSTELDYINRGEIDGADSSIIQTVDMPMMPMMDGDNTSPTAIPSNYGGSWLYATLGVDVPVNLFTVGLDLSLPIYQDLNGVQMKHQSITTISVQAMF